MRKSELAECPWGQNISWQLPRCSAALMAALNFPIDPFPVVFEGCGYVPEVARLCFMHSATGSLPAWAALIDHHGLFASSLILFGMASASLREFVARIIEASHGNTSNPVESGGLALPVENCHLWMAPRGSWSAAASWMGADWCGRPTNFGSKTLACPSGTAFFLVTDSTEPIANFAANVFCW
jgi:hypothetical protein